MTPENKRRPGQGVSGTSGYRPGQLTKPAKASFVKLVRPEAAVIRSKLRRPIQRDILTGLVLLADHKTAEVRMTFSDLAQELQVSRKTLWRELADGTGDLPAAVLITSGLLEVARAKNAEGVSVIRILCWEQLTGSNLRQVAEPAGSRAGFHAGANLSPAHPLSPVASHPKNKNNNKKGKTRQSAAIEPLNLKLKPDCHKDHPHNPWSHTEACHAVA